MKNLILIILVFNVQTSFAEPVDCKYTYDADRDQWSVVMGEDPRRVWYNDIIGVTTSMEKRKGRFCNSYKVEEHTCTFESGVVKLDGEPISPKLDLKKEKAFEFFKHFCQPEIK